MCPLVPTLNCVKLKDYLLVPVTIHTICMVLFMPTKTVGTHAATCDRVVLVEITHCRGSKVPKKAPLTDTFYFVNNMPKMKYHVCVIHSITET